MPDGISPEEPQGRSDDTLERVIQHTTRGLGLLEGLTGWLRNSSEDLRRLTERVQRLEQLAMIDPLTGLLNRRGLEEAVTREEGRARRYGTSIAAALIDVDSLKDINDRYGHAAGDALLQAMGASLRAHARASDSVARYGGDEFVVLLPDADRSGAVAFIERVRNAVQSVRLADDVAVALRFSAGVASRAETGSLHDTIALADHRLVAAKQHRSPDDPAGL